MFLTHSLEENEQISNANALVQLHMRVPQMLYIYVICKKEMFAWVSFLFLLLN